MRAPNKILLWITVSLSLTCCEENPVWFREQQPDISGEWVISVPDISVEDWTHEEGSCVGIEFQISLPRKEIKNTRYGVDLSGSHTGFSLACSGFTGSLEDWLGEDTVVVVPPGSLDGDMSYGHGCDENDPWPCEIPIWWILKINGAEFSLYSDSIVRLDGLVDFRGTLEWPHTFGGGYWPSPGVLEGEFTAHRVR